MIHLVLQLLYLVDSSSRAGAQAPCPGCTFPWPCQHSANLARLRQLSWILVDDASFRSCQRAVIWLHTHKCFREKDEDEARFHDYHFRYTKRLRCIRQEPCGETLLLTPATLKDSRQRAGWTLYGVIKGAPKCWMNAATKPFLGCLLQKRYTLAVHTSTTTCTFSYNPAGSLGVLDIRDRDAKIIRAKY